MTGTKKVQISGKNGLSGICQPYAGCLLCGGQEILYRIMATVREHIEWGQVVAIWDNGVSSAEAATNQPHT